MTASELSSKAPVAPTDLVERARADLVAGDPVGAQTAALVAIAAALVERTAPRLPELREGLAIRVDKGVLTAAAIEANARLKLPVDLATAEVFAQIVVDVINRGRS